MAWLGTKIRNSSITTSMIYVAAMPIAITVVHVSSSHRSQL